MALPTALQKQANKVDSYYKNTGNDEPTLEQEKQNTETPEQKNKPQAQTSEQKDDIDYRAKYKTLEGKYNAEVPRLHEQIKTLNQQITTLSATAQDASKVSQLEAQIKELQDANSQLMQSTQQRDNGAEIQLSEYLSNEYGDEFAQAVAEQARLIANAEISRVNKELDSVKNQFKQTQDTVTQSKEQSNFQTLSSMLQSQGINFAEIDSDPLFHNWLATVDQRSGMTYHDLMHQAFRSGDLQRTASFYTEYNASQPRSNRNLNEYADPLNTVSQSDMGNNNQPFDPSAFTRLAEQFRRKQITREEYEQKERELFRRLNRQ